MSPTTAAETPGRRIVLANLVAHLAPGAARAQALEQFNEALERHVLPFADLAGTSGGAERRTALIDMDTAELAEKWRLLPGRAVAEPEMLRSPALAYPAPLLPTRRADLTAPGTGSKLALRLVNRRAEGVGGATVLVAFHSSATPPQSVTSGAVSDAAGNVELAYDQGAWLPAFVAVEPAGGYWTLAAALPQSGQALLLHELDDGGPLQWWQLVCGAAAGAGSAGRGVRVGVVDTGIGPHPALGRPGIQSSDSSR